MGEFEKKIRALLEELSVLCSGKNGFEFWKKLKEAGELLEKMPQKKLGKVEKNVFVEGKLFVSKAAVVKAGTRIEGTAYIGEGSVIGPNAFLRGFVAIGENCHVGQSEVKNSVFLGHSNAPHYSYIGDSLIGENVNLGAGTKIANLRHDNQNIKVTINGKQVDSGQRKLGALVGSGAKTGVNSSINCGTIVPPNTRILPNGFYK
ncbi:MAG: hypothetical protein HY392_02090 [Candidatus Diapherotrites archaeon]|nr:hypothetical protein [Candidatus Diapherotrites archaeon]